MASIYIHIPFCRRACHYCDFHFSTSLKHKTEMLQALKAEIALRKAYLPVGEISSVYFGGGTPSLLSGAELNALFVVIEKHFQLAENCEITLEANPDDLDGLKVADLKNTPVNRLSIGVQSFFEEDLQWMNRAHNANEALDSIKRVQDAGFENLNADLIYGFPLLSDEKWRQNIKQMLELGIPHLSCYSMTVEPQTALDSFIKKGKQKPMDEEQSAAQFEILMDTMDENGFLQYEISNFCKPGQYSRHNTAYWEQKPYLGIGPSAHSYNGESRQWNVANNHRYIEGMVSHKPYFEKEVLSPSDRFNEYMMTALRTMWGVDRQLLRSRFRESLQLHTDKAIQPFVDTGKVDFSEDCYRLSRSGKLLADHIVAALFVSE